MFHVVWLWKCLFLKTDSVHLVNLRDSLSCKYVAGFMTWRTKSRVIGKQTKAWNRIYLKPQRPIRCRFSQVLGTSVSGWVHCLPVEFSFHAFLRSSKDVFQCQFWRPPVFSPFRCWQMNNKLYNLPSLHWKKNSGSCMKTTMILSKGGAKYHERGTNAEQKVSARKFRLCRERPVIYSNRRLNVFMFVLRSRGGCCPPPPLPMGECDFVSHKSEQVLIC